MYQGDAAANEEHRGGKTTKAQVPTVDNFTIPPTLAISKTSNDFFSTSTGSPPAYLICEICSQLAIFTIFALAGANVEFWALWPISWSLPRPQRKYSEILTAKGTWRSGEW